MFQKEKNEKLTESDTREWFIIVDNQQKGPYSLLDLKKHPQFTPDTLVWKKGFKEWTRARFVPELRNLFKDDPEPCPLHEQKDGKTVKGEIAQESQATLTLQQDPYQFLLWILLILIIILYTFFYRF